MIVSMIVALLVTLIVLTGGGGSSVLRLVAAVSFFWPSVLASTPVRVHGGLATRIRAQARPTHSVRR